VVKYLHVIHESQHNTNTITHNGLDSLDDKMDLQEEEEEVDIASIADFEDTEHTQDITEKVSDNIPSIGTPEKCTVDSTLEVQSPSSPCVSHSSEASLFSIDSPPHPDSPTGNREMDDDEGIDVDDVIDGVFDSVNDCTDVHTSDESLRFKREQDVKKVSQNTGRNIADRTELSDGYATQESHIVNMKTEGRNRSDDVHELDEESDTVSSDNKRASRKFIGAYIRLELGTYKGRVARITSMSRCRSRYSVSVLKYDGIRQLSKHTTIVAGTQNLLEESSYTPQDAAVIEQDKEYLKVREGATAGMVQNRLYRSEELQRNRSERTVSKSNDGENNGADEGENLNTIMYIVCLAVVGNLGFNVSDMCYLVIPSHSALCHLVNITNN
jgi:hypothetical protein